MARAKPLKICPGCDKVLTSCGCGHRKATNDSLVHKGCLNKYNYMLEKEKSEQKKREE